MGFDGDISRRSYLSAFGSVLLGTFGIGSTKAYNEYQEWRNTPFSKDMQIIGHRGANGLAPQNTEKGIRTAAKYGVDGVELDVQETGDGELVMFHDPIYNVGTDNGSGFVEEVPYSKAKHFTIEGEPLLTLDEALTIVKGFDLDLYLEVKSPNIIKKCLKVVKQHGWKNRTTFISLDLPYLNGAHNKIDTALIKKTPSVQGVQIANAQGCKGVATHYSPVNQSDFIRKAERAGLNSIIWNLFDTRTSVYDSLISDADILIANRPDIIAQLYKENGISKLKVPENSD